MGARLSGLTTAVEYDDVSGASDDGPGQVLGLGDLPDCCVAMALSWLEPAEICRLALVNTTFRRASSFDAVWNSKLPENYDILVEKIFGDECAAESLSKKHIFERLCRRNRFSGDDNKEVWLEKNGGGVCVLISWKGMKITGIDDRRRWNHISTDESRFNTVAYLQETWWLEAQGSLEFNFPKGRYSLFFRLHLGRPSKRRGRRRVCDVDQVHGWNIQPVHFHLSSSSDVSCRPATKYYLNDEPPGRWTHYHVGDFVVHDSMTTTELKFSMTQIDCTHNKGGLCFDSVLICPSGIVQSLKCLDELDNVEMFS